jgi:hypothetical protein
MKIFASSLDFTKGSLALLVLKSQSLFSKENVTRVGEILIETRNRLLGARPEYFSSSLDLSFFNAVDTNPHYLGIFFVMNFLFLSVLMCQ